MNQTTCNPTDTRAVRPALHSHEDEAGVNLEVALPGVLKDDLKFSVLNGTLQIEAERRDVTPSVRYRLTARLASRLDGSRITAKLDNGVLSAHVPLREEALPKSIPVV